MLKKTDFLLIIMSFFAIMAFYLIFAGSLEMNIGNSGGMESISIPEDYSITDECRTENAGLVVLYGNQGDSEKTQKIISMLSNLKIDYDMFSIVDDIGKQQAEKMETIVVTAGSWEEIGNKDLLIQYAREKGKDILFVDVLEEESGKYNRKIGILKNGGRVNIKGLMIFEEMLVQGMEYYDDLKINVADIRVDARCKKFVVEQSKKKKEQRELIPLVWRKLDGKGSYYVVNGSFLTEGSGMGILTGILSQMQDDFIYPVVNAKICILDYFPELNNPYEDEIEKLYGRNTNMFIRDIIWPSIVKLGEVYDLSFSARMRGQVSEDTVLKYEALKKMMKKWQYEIEDDLEEQEFELPYICRGHERSDIDTMNMQSSVSGEGLASQYLDMSEIMGRNADNVKYEWSSYSLELSKKMSSLYKDMDWIDALPISQARERYKRYLVMKPAILKSESQITIDTGRFYDMCFYIIRTDKKILSGDGYEAKKVGDNAWLIEVFRDSVAISLGEVVK